MYGEEKTGWVKHLDFTLIDLVCIQASLVIAYAWRFSGRLLFYEDIYVRIAILAALLDLVVVFFAEPYNGILRRTRYQEIRATFTFCILVFGGLLSYMYALKRSELYSRPLLFVYLFTSMFLCYFSRVSWKIVVRQRKLRDKNKAIMTVVAENDNVEACLREIAMNKYTNFKVTGVVVVDKDRRGETIMGVPVVACADDFLDYVRKNVVDEVFIDGNTRASSEALATELIELGTTVHMSLVHSNRLVPNRQLDNYGTYIVLTSSMKIATFRQLVVKRAMDILGGIVGLLITAVAFVIFAPIIKIQSPGPVFYQSIRIGRNGRRFKFYKFRTMIPDADKHLQELAEKNEMQGKMFKMEDDPRIIPIGHFMRKYSIDELPQFWNVLKGDMSLVGTRPPTEDEFATYEYHHKARLGIRPGLTGMWQVSGRSDITDFEEVVALDTEYIMNWTLGLDIRILFKTIGVVLSGKGSK
ncbi:MAG: sugar transferase [Lachnospiraceae bacterium]|nr:sugar transferase [Lachnospiraceae bacterium]